MTGETLEPGGSITARIRSQACIKLYIEEVLEEHKLAKFYLEHQGNTYFSVGLGVRKCFQKG